MSGRIDMEKGLRQSILGGLIASMLVILFIQPLLSFTWRMITLVGGLVHEGYVDRIYRNAAVIGTNPYGPLTVLMLVLTCLFAVIFWLDRLWESGSDNLVRFIKVEWAISRGLLVGLALVILVKAAILQGTVRIDESFKQRLAVLTPAITDAECKTLKARWASMQGKADYDAIVAGMDKRATELGVTLPPVRKP
jgi:hypothetical protein